MWECQFTLQIVQNQALKRFLEDADDVDQDILNPRDAFFGGRTNCTKLYCEAQEGEKIRYLDVCSLYPWACKTGKFPLGHPKILVGDDCPQHLDGIDGLVKATILPPSDLYHPVLPVRIHGKLYFPLCGKCVEKLTEEDCTHPDESRQITGTWVSDEIKLALSKGYAIVKIHEIWSYETTQYNGREGGLFVDYINKFLKLKQEASGWPSWVKTDADQLKYIEDFERKEGVLLTKAFI